MTDAAMAEASSICPSGTTLSPMPTNRPDFIPWIWDPTERNRALWSRPDKVLRYLIVYAPASMAVLTLLAWTLGGRTTQYLALVGVAVVVLNAAVYGPRAWRADRRGHANSRG
jgi:hypothetical protein